MSSICMWRSMRFSVLLVGLLGLCLSLGSVAVAQDESGDSTAEVAADPGEGTEEAAAEEEAASEDEDLGVGYALDNAFLFIAAVMVFFMQAGFAMVESGFNAQKNAVNVLFKNAMDICVGILLFFVVGIGMEPICK